MNAVKLSDFRTNSGPALALYGSIGSATSAGDPEDSSLCLAWKGLTSSKLYYSVLPWTTENHFSKADIASRPALCSTPNDIGQVWAWKNATGIGMSWSANGVTGIQSVPNHAHTVGSPVTLMVGEAIDPDSGSTNYNVFTLFWQGDAKSGGNGTSHELWFMSYADAPGWNSPTRIPGASPATSPAACLGPSSFNVYGTTLAWADRNGQIWICSGDSSGNADAPWSTPIPGPVSCTYDGPAICYFKGSLIVAWIAAGMSQIMYSVQSFTQDGELTWSDPAVLVNAISHDTPALSEHKGKLYVAWADAGDSSISYETFGSLSDLPQSTTNRAGVPMLISNTVVGHAYTGTLLIGAQADPVNCIIDTGSSSLAALKSKYNASADELLIPTALCQYDAYGPNGETGYWFGPVVETLVGFSAVPGVAAPLPVAGINVSVAIADDSTATHPVFAGADGILGLAYPSLNVAYDLTVYLTKEGKPPVTYPWPISSSQAPTTLSAFDSFISAAAAAQLPVPPCLTELSQDGLLPNKFALYVYRALENLRTSTPATDASNYGTLVLGGGEDFFVNEVGPFQTAQVVQDSFYFVNLLSVQVGNNPPIPFPLFSSENNQTSTALIDSGTSGIVLPATVFTEVLNQLQAEVPNYSEIVSPMLQAYNKYLDFSQWPPLTFVLAASDGSQISLNCYPPQYWQTDAEPQGVAQCMLQPVPGDNQPAILGLAFLTGYYTIFDRSISGFGVVKFAQKPLM